MKISDIKSIHVSHSVVGLCLEWKTAGARYHVWMLDTQTLSGTTLYKNPPEGVQHRGPGYFPTRHLLVSAPCNRIVVDHVLAEARRLDLFVVAAREYQLEQDRKNAKHREDARISHIQQAGPALYAALKALTAQAYISMSGGYGELLDNAAAALADAEKSE